ncbi:MAG: FAD-dependent oxidoreductase [Candidatus Lokiarchaeota archaeon]|nr:FAD-dependent oxidoreductase [Candidatus Lokiarchaeota archaeon]
MIGTGFKPNTDFLNIEAAKINLDERQYVKVYEYLETSNPHIWAIGDVVGKQQITHMALRESKIVLNNIFSDNKRRVQFEDIPFAVFTEPIIGSVGKTEEQLKKSGISYKISQTELPRCSRGYIMGLKRGYVKILHNQKEIFGCHIIGEDADNLIHEIVPLIGQFNGWEIFLNTIYAHPTLSEIFTRLPPESKVL